MLKMILLLGALAFIAAIPVQQATTEKKEKYLENGVFVGGYHQPALTLLGIRHSYRVDLGLERFVVDVVNEGDSPAKRPGFFHISIQNEKKRVLIDLQNIRELKMSETQFSKLLQKSKFFSKAAFYFDKRTHDLTIEMFLKDRTSIEVFELTSPGKPGRIVLDAKAP